MDKRAAIYVRVSTDKQTIENQLRELRLQGATHAWSCSFMPRPHSPSHLCAKVPLWETDHPSTRITAHPLPRATARLSPRAKSARWLSYVGVGTRAAQVKLRVRLARLRRRRSLA
jgi:hypothetical protein